MTSRRRTIVVALGVLAALGPAGCAGYAADGYSSAGNNNSANENAAAPSVAPTPTAEDSSNANAAPVGSPTDKLIGISIPRMGKVVTDAKGWVLYRFDRDAAKPPATNCYDKCAQIWPPVLTDGQPQLQGVAESLVGTVTRKDGATQITLGGWPLYRYVGDEKPGQWRGQFVGGTWFVAAPDGKKNVTCLPTFTPTPVEPPAPAAGATPGTDY